MKESNNKLSVLVAVDGKLHRSVKINIQAHKNSNEQASRVSIAIDTHTYTKLVFTLCTHDDNIRVNIHPRY